MAFPYVWRMIRPWLDPITVSKIQILGEDGWMRWIDRIDGSWDEYSDVSDEIRMLDTDWCNDDDTDDYGDDVKNNDHDGDDNKNNDDDGDDNKNNDDDNVGNNSDDDDESEWWWW